MNFIDSLLNFILWTKPYSIKYWLIDISHWNSITQAQMDDMAAHGLAGVWIQVVNGITPNSKLQAQIDLCHRSKLPFGLYAWLDPTLDPISQVDAGLKEYKEHGPDACNWMTDIEQEHISQVDSNTARLSASTIYRASVAYFDYLEPKLSIPIVVYSGPNFLNNVCPQLIPRVKKYFYLNASYGSNVELTLSWDAFADALKNIHASSIPKLLKQTDVDGVQWTSNWHIQSDAGTIYERIDLDAIQDETVYKQLFGNTVIIVPPETEPGTLVVTAAYALTVHSEPGGGKVLGYLKYNDEVELLTISKDGKWGYVQSAESPAKLFWPFKSFAGIGWISLAYTK
jgi:GH25 family lysozyme M1 (1,4-beta-N-acetylmuramidase)